MKRVIIVKITISNCSKQRFFSCLNLHITQGRKAQGFDKLSIDTMFESYKTGFYGKINPDEMWLLHYDNDKLIKAGGRMLFCFELNESGNDLELCGKWRFPKWYRRIIPVYFILPLFISFPIPLREFDFSELLWIYFFCLLAFGLYYLWCRLCCDEDKITELINKVADEAGI